MAGENACRCEIMQKQFISKGVIYIEEITGTFGVWILIFVHLSKSVKNINGCDQRLKLYSRFQGRW